MRSHNSTGVVVLVVFVAVFVCAYVRTDVHSSKNGYEYLLLYTRVYRINE